MDGEGCIYLLITISGNGSLLSIQCKLAEKLSCDELFRFATFVDWLTDYNDRIQTCTKLYNMVNEDDEAMQGGSIRKAIREKQFKETEHDSDDT